MMKFTQWAEETNKDLASVLRDTEPTEGPNVSEKTMRSGIRGQYPDAYVRSQYPDGYFMPISASAKLDLDNAKKYTRSVADKGGRAAE